MTKARLHAGRTGDGALATGAGAFGGALVVASGAVHLYLYFNGYGSIPTIGPLFVLQGVVAWLLGGAVLATGLSRVLRRGLLPGAPRLHYAVLAGAAALFALATLGGYVLSLEVGLLGFREVPTTPGALAGALEVAAVAMLGEACALGLRARWRKLLAPLVAPATGAAALALALGLVLAQPGVAAGSPGGAGQSVVAIDVPGYGQVLATPKHWSLYLLSDEGPGHVTCTGGCLSLWPPLLMSRAHGGPHLEAGPGVAGKLGLIRTGSSEQVTYNGFPLYTYSGDPGPAASAGQGIESFGGTWHLVRASARSRAATPVTG